MMQQLNRRFGGTNTRRLTWVISGLAVGLILMCFSTWQAVSQQFRRTREAHAEVLRTREVLDQIQRLLSLMQDAETGERGFLVTGETTFLEPFSKANDSFEPLLGRISDIMRDNDGRQMYEELARRSREQLAYLNGIVSKRREGNAEQASALVAQFQGKAQMDALRALVETLRTRQEFILDARLASFAKSSRKSEQTAGVSLATAVLLLLIASALTARHYHRRKLAETAYRDQATRLDATLNNIADGIVTINESGSIESWSKGAELMFGYTSEEVLRRNVNILMPEPYASAHDGYLRRHIATGERRIMGTRRELEARHKDGHRFPIELAVSEMHLNSRRVFIGSLRDVAMRKEVERLKSEFVSTVSHELRTPLTSISGALGLLAGVSAGALPEKAQRLLDIALSNSNRLVRLINDILDLEKAESGKMVFTLEPLEIKAIVLQAIEMNRGVAQSLGVMFELDLTSEDGIILVDRDRLIQVITNLLSNAAKFSPRDGTVRVAIRTEQDDIRVEVHDEGAGIAPEFQKRIFQKFAQADSSDARAKGGTGLGLSISKTLIEQLGGSIGFTSEQGKGTTFYFSLPLHRLARKGVISHGTSTVPSILVCEDDPDVADVIRAELVGNGMRVHVVATAEAAAAALQNDSFCAILTDVDLLDSNGLDFIAELRKDPATRDITVIVSSAHARTANDEQRLNGLQLAAWLEKPVDTQDLVRVILEALADPDRKRAAVLHVEDEAA